MKIIWVRNLWCLVQYHAADKCLIQNFSFCFFFFCYFHDPSIVFDKSLWNIRNMSFYWFYNLAYYDYIYINWLGQTIANGMVIVVVPIPFNREEWDYKVAGHWLTDWLTDWLSEWVSEWVNSFSRHLIPQPRAKQGLNSPTSLEKAITEAFHKFIVRNSKLEIGALLKSLFFFHSTLNDTGCVMAKRIQIGNFLYQNPGK